MSNRDLSKARKNDNGEIEETDDPYNLGPVNIDDVSITNFTVGPDYLFWQEGGDIWVFDSSYEVVAGGPDAIGVSDQTDFAEVLAEVVNNVATADPAIYLASASPGRTNYQCKSQQSLNRHFGMAAPFKNRVQVEVPSSLSSPVFSVTDPTDDWMLQLNRIKFNGRSNVDRMFSFDGVNELMVGWCEFTNFNVEGFEHLNALRWDFIVNSMFVSGSGFTVDGSDWITAANNHFEADVTISNCDGVHGLESNWMGSAYNLSLSGNTYSDLRWQLQSNEAIKFNSGHDFLDVDNNTQMAHVEQASGNNRGWNFYAANVGEGSDATLFDNSLMWEIDEANNDLVITVQYSDGTQVSGTIALS